MSGYRWNNRFNPPLETGSTRFPRAPVETPHVPTNRLTHQMPGAPPLILCTNQITSIPDLSMSIVTSNIVELTVTLDVSFGYRMTGDDHFEFTFTNSNTGVSTIKRFQQPGNPYTIGEFDPGVNYFVYVTPVINGLLTASSGVQEFLSSPASAPGILQGITLTGSGSYAVINFAGVYPTSPFPNQVAVDDNFGNPQILVDVSFGNRQLVIGPYTNGSSYQFVLTPVTRSDQGIYRYGSTSTIPSGNNYFIPGPPGILNINSIYANGPDGTTVNITMSSDTIVHPIPDSFETVLYTSTLSRTIATLTGVSGQINDLSTSYPAFTVSSGLISTQDYLTLSAAVGSSNLVADITDNTGVWYSFRVSSISSGNVYTFTNPNLTKSVLTGSSFSVNFNTLTLSEFITAVSFGTPVIELSNVQTDTYTTFITRAFANNVYSVEAEYATIFAGPPALPNAGTYEVGNETVRWTLGMYGYNLPQNETIPIGPRPIYYTIDQDGVPVQTISGFVATISGLTNETSYTLAAAGFANGVYGPSNTITAIPDFAAPTSLAVTRISNVNVTLSLGRPLGGTQYGYIVSACGLGGYSVTVPDQDTDYIPVSITGLAPSDYQFIAYTQYQDSPSNVTTLSAEASGSYYLGPPSAPSNVQGIYLGTSYNGDILVDLVLTASHGSGAIVTNYLLEHNYGAQITVSALPNQDLYYNFTYLYAYNSYIFTITPIGNEVLGPPVNSATFDFNPQPPSPANLFMTGGNGGTMNITFTGSDFPYGQTTDYYTISAIQTSFTTGETQKFVSNSPVSYDAAGVLYQFAVYTTICGIISSTFALTPAVTGGPPLKPNVGYTLGSNQITFSLSVNANSAVKIGYYFITEYYQDVISGGFLPTGTTYTIPVTPSLTPVATYTISGLFTTSYSILAPADTWDEGPYPTPEFYITPNTVITDPLALLTYPNLVTLTLSQGSTGFSFPVTGFSVNGEGTGYTTYVYGTPLVAATPDTFATDASLQFTWRSGTGPFTGGTYRYDFQSLGNDTLISPVTSTTINLYVAAAGQPSVVTNNTTATVTFNPPSLTSVTPAYYVVSDNYGRTVSGTTNLSSFVFTNCTTGSAYSFFVTTYAQGISSAPSQLSATVYPGRPGPPSFQPSFSYATGSAILTLSTLLNQGPTLPYIPITDICLRIQGQLPYTVTKTNISGSYTSNGPTFTVVGLALGESYTFTISAYANQVYSTIASSYSYYVGSIPPDIPNLPSIFLSNTTAYISVSAAKPSTRIGGINPDVYVFLTSNIGGSRVSSNIPYSAGTNTYTCQFNNLAALSDYLFSGYTVTAGLSYGSSWTDAPRTFNAAGPRPITDVAYSLPAGTPLTTNVSLKTVITTGCAGITGLWADTSYYINVSSSFIPFGRITCNVTTPTSGEIQFTTIAAGNVVVIIAGGGGGAGAANDPGTGPEPGFNGGGGGYVQYTFSNIPAGTGVTYKVGGGGAAGGDQPGGGGGESSYVRINALQVTAGGGGGGAQPFGWSGSDGEGPYGGAGGSNSVGADGSGGPVGTITMGGGGAGGTKGAGGGGSGGGGYVSITYEGYEFSLMTLSSYTATVSAGGTYYASVYGIKNQVTGSRAVTGGFNVPPTPPTAPTITLVPTPDINVVGPDGGTEVLYATWPQGSTPFPPYVTLAPGNFTVTVAGAGGGGLVMASGDNLFGGGGGLITYTFSNIPAGTPIFYVVGFGGGGLYTRSAGGGAGSAVSINNIAVFAGGGGGAGGSDSGNGIGGGGAVWGGGITPSLANNLPGQDSPTTIEGGRGGGNFSSRDGGGAGGIYGNGGPGSGGGPPGSVITGGGGGLGGTSQTYFYGLPGYVRILYSPTPTTIPSTLQWTPALTSDVTYYYSINRSSYVNNDGLTTAAKSLEYGGTYSIDVYSQLNGISSGIVKSISAYVFTNPPTNLNYGRTSNNITLSWGSAFQPAYASNITYTTSVTLTANVSGLSIRSTGGPSVVIGSNIMTESIYLQINTAAGITKQPIVVTLSGLSLSYYQTYQVTSATKETFGNSGVIGYQFSGVGPSLPNYTGSNIVFSITNPSALPTDGYTVRDLCSATIIASNIQSNSITVPLTLGNTYDIAVQAFNLSMYSLTNSARTGVFKLETTAVATLSTTYVSSNVKLTWKTPTQFDGVTPNTTPPYSWTIFDASGLYQGKSSPAAQSFNIVKALGGTYHYYIIANYYGISSAPTYGNQISLLTTPPPSVTQTTLGQGIIVAWQTASQSVYLPETPTVLSSVFPSGGYVLTDLCGNYTGTVNAAPEDTDVYIPIPAPPYKSYNFAVRAIHNSISSTATAPGAIYLGVNPPTNPAISLNGMVATLIWNAPSINGPNSPYRIYDANGYPLGDPTTNALRTITCNAPGIYSFTAIANETIAVTAYGAGGSVGAGGLASNTYSVTSGTTVVAKVGAAGPAGDSTTVYVPNFFNPNLILDAGGGGGFTVSGEGFFRNGGLPYPDGGPPGQPGYGSGGSAVLGGGSSKSTDGQVSITMTSQEFKSSISTAMTSISFLIANATSYNFQIVSYSNGLTASASITLNTFVASPSNLRTKFTGIILSNEWDLPETIPSGFLLTNLTSGTYNVVAPGTITNETFSETGVPGQRYRFALYSVKSGIPSSTQIISTSVLLFSTSPSNFKGSNNGTTVTFTASGVPGTPLETFTLTDGSGNLINSGIPQFIVNGVASVQIPPIIGLTPGRTYAFNLYGITSGLSSLPEPTSVVLTIPGSTSLGLPPYLSPGVTITQTASGTYSYTTLSNSSIYITVDGAGGSGGSSAGYDAGAGGRAEYIYTDVPAGTSITYTVGGAGIFNGNYYTGGDASTVTLVGKTIIGGGGGGSFDGTDSGNEGGPGGGGIYGGAGGNRSNDEGGEGYPGSGGWGDPVGPGPIISTTGGGSPQNTAGRVSFVISYGGTGTYNLTVNQCIPPADSFKAVSTNLTSTIYSNLPTARWLGVAMEIDGGTVVAINNASNGSNIYISTNQGLGWGLQYTAGLSGATAVNVTIAANGTWGAMTTISHGLWVSSNVSIFSPWFQVGNTVGSNILSAGFSPDGSKLIVGQLNGYLYSISSSQLSNPSPVFTGGQGVLLEKWVSVAWSGDGNMVFAASGGDRSGCLYSITGGTFWTSFTSRSIFTSISPNSNGTYVLVGGISYPSAFRRDPTNYVFTSVFPGIPLGLPSLGSGKYVCACSYTGDIQLALISTGLSAYASYDFGSSWVADTRFSAPGGFTASAISSNGFVQVVVGLSAKLQTMISTPLITTTTTTIPIATTSSSANGFVPIGATGYEIIPYFRNIPGPNVFLWTTPQNGPTVWGQTSGPASFTIPPYASGYDIVSGKLVGYFVINNTTATTITSNQLLVGAGATLAPTPSPSNSNVQVFSLTATTDLYPGVYTAKFSVASGNSSTSTIMIPLRPPTALALTNQTTNIYGTWTAPNVIGSPDYSIYSNGVFISNTTNLYATISCTGVIPTNFGVSASLGGVVSTTISSPAYPPPSPQNLRISGYVTATTIELTWTPVSGASYYYITSNSNLVSSSITANAYVVSLQFQGNPTVFGVAALSNNLLGAYSFVTATNRIGSVIAQGITRTVAVTTSFVVTGMYIVGGGGGGGSGGYGAAGGPGQPPTGLQGGGGGAQGGIELFTAGTEPIYSPGTTLTLVAGKAGIGGLFGGGGTGGELSYVKIGGNTVTWAGGGGGGGGGNGGFGSAGGRIETNGITGNGGSGGSAPSNTNGGGGGYGGWGNYVGVSQTPLPIANYSPTIGSNGQNRQGTPPNATTGGAGGGPSGGAAQPSFGGTGNYAGGLGCGGGGGARSANPTGNPTTAPPGGPGSDGYISLSYAYLTS